MSDNSGATKVQIDLASAVLMAFICFYLVGGWERLDCYHGMQTACSEVQSWHKKPKQKE